MIPLAVILASQTLPPGVRLADRIRIAADAGYPNIGIRARDRREAHTDGVSDNELRALLVEHRVTVAELEVVVDWAAEGELAARSRRAEDRLLDVADALGGEYLVAVSEIDMIHERNRIVVAGRRFAELCRRAADHGLRVGIEFLPWTSIPDAATAFQIVETAGQVNGGIVIDAWHHFRGGGGLDDLRLIPIEHIVAVQLDDASSTVVGELLDDTLRRRLLPGDGDFALAEFINNLVGHGFAGPWSVEVISDQLHALGAEVAALRSFECADRLLRGARTGA